MTDSIQSQIEELEQKYPGWDMCITRERWFHVYVKAQGLRYAVTQPKLGDALADVLSWVPLPLVPREPQTLCEADFKISKDRSMWHVESDLGYACFKTKKDAQEWIGKVIPASISSHSAWLVEYGWIRQKTEGVDFRFHG